MVRYRTVDVFESIIQNNAAWFESRVIHAARELDLPNTPTGVDPRRLERLVAVLARIDGWEDRAPATPAIDQGWGSGDLVQIPDGWALCDGTSGTPDLRNRFIVGAGGGYPVGQSATSSATVNIDSTTTVMKHGCGSGNVWAGFGQDGCKRTIPNAFTVTDVMPSHYALAYIMKL